MTQHQSLPLCIACRRPLNHAKLPLCEACQCDNSRWIAHHQRGFLAQAGQFFLGSLWGWLSLLALSLPLLSYKVMVYEFISVDMLALLSSFYFSLMGLVLIFLKRDALWTWSLQRAAVAEEPDWLLCRASWGFAIFSPFGAMLVLMWLTASLLRYMLLLHTFITLLLSLAFLAGTLALGFYALFAYGEKLARTCGLPLFYRAEAFADWLEPVMLAHIQMQLGNSQSQIISYTRQSHQRTAQAGLSVIMTLTLRLPDLHENRYQTCEQRWQIDCDTWGHIQHCRLLESTAPTIAPDPVPDAPLRGDVVMMP